MQNTQSFGDFVVTAMDAVEAAHQAGILLYMHEYVARNPNLSSRQQQGLITGCTSHVALFEQYKAQAGYPIMKFRLKEGVSASTALLKLLSEGQSVIDCMTAISVAYNYAVFLGFQASYGDAVARQRFDALFGSETQAIPKARRLFFGNNMYVAWHLWDATGHLIPLTALSILFEVSDFNKLAWKYHKEGRIIIPVLKDGIFKKLPKGSMIAFAGCPEYTNKHPQGSDGNYNGIVQGHTIEGKPLLKVFGCGDRPFIEQQLSEKHIEAYNSPCTPDDRSVQQAIRKSGKNCSYPETITQADVPGLSLKSHYVVNEEKWKTLLTSTQEEAIVSLTHFLNSVIEARLGSPALADKSKMRDEDLALLPIASHQPADTSRIPLKFSTTMPATPVPPAVSRTTPMNPKKKK